MPSTSCMWLIYSIGVQACSEITATLCLEHKHRLRSEGHSGQVAHLLLPVSLGAEWGINHVFISLTPGLVHLRNKSVWAPDNNWQSNGSMHRYWFSASCCSLWYFQPCWVLGQITVVLFFCSWQLIASVSLGGLESVMNLGGTMLKNQHTDLQFNLIFFLQVKQSKLNLFCILTNAVRCQVSLLLSVPVCAPCSILAATNKHRHGWRPQCGVLLQVPPGWML